MTVCVCALQTSTSAETGRASTTRCVCAALAGSPACVNPVTLVSCVRQVSGGLHSPVGEVGISFQRKSNSVSWHGGKVP